MGDLDFGAPDPELAAQYSGRSYSPSDSVPIVEANPSIYWDVITTHYIAIADDDPETIKNASDGWAKLSLGFKDLAAAIRSKGTTLGETWDGDASDAFLLEVGRTTSVLDNWSEQAKKNSDALSVLYGDFSSQRKDLMAKYDEYKKKYDDLIKEENSNDTAGEFFADVVEEFGGKDRLSANLEKFSKDSRLILDKVDDSFSTAYAVLGSGAAFTGPRNAVTREPPTPDGGGYGGAPPAPPGMPGGITPPALPPMPPLPPSAGLTLNPAGLPNGLAQQILPTLSLLQSPARTIDGLKAREDVLDHLRSLVPNRPEISDRQGADEIGGVPALPPGLLRGRPLATPASPESPGMVMPALPNWLVPSLPSAAPPSPPAVPVRGGTPGGVRPAVPGVPAGGVPGVRGGLGGRGAGGGVPRLPSGLRGAGAAPGLGGRGAPARPGAPSTKGLGAGAPRLGGRSGKGVPGEGVPGRGVPGKGVPGKGVPGKGMPGSLAGRGGKAASAKRLAGRGVVPGLELGESGSRSLGGRLTAGARVRGGTVEAARAALRRSLAGRSGEAVGGSSGARGAVPGSQRLRDRVARARAVSTDEDVLLEMSLVGGTELFEAENKGDGVVSASAPAGPVTHAGPALGTTGRQG